MNDTDFEGSMGWVDQLDPPFLFIFYILAGTLWMVLPFLNGAPRETPQQEVHAPETHAAERARLEELFREKREEARRLQQALAEAQRPKVETDSGAPMVAITGKQPVFVELVENRVVPVTEENYQTQNVTLPEGGTGTVYERTRPGESIEEMRQSTGALTGILRKLQRDSQYLAVILHSDSFEAFRALREIARDKKMAVGWEPYRGT
ncbi:MAG: hypothetical protein ACRD1T_25700, partial [Acidimicrobiia bacterium]